MSASCLPVVQKVTMFWLRFLKWTLLARTQVNGTSRWHKLCWQHKESILEEPTFVSCLMLSAAFDRQTWNNTNTLKSKTGTWKGQYCQRVEDILSDSFFALWGLCYLAGQQADVSSVCLRWETAVIVNSCDLGKSILMEMRVDRWLSRSLIEKTLSMHGCLWKTSLFLRIQRFVSLMHSKAFGCNGKHAGV